MTSLAMIGTFTGRRIVRGLLGLGSNAEGAFMQRSHGRSRSDSHLFADIFALWSNINVAATQSMIKELFTAEPGLFLI